MDFIDVIESYSQDCRVAQIYRNDKLTYKALREKSDALAAYIIDKLGEDKSPILVYGHKQHEMLISFFACSKSGHAYIPIDITFPSARVKDIIENSGAKLFLNIGDLEYSSSSLEILKLNNINDIVKSYSGKVPERSFRVKEDENYYILYTSGSTGKPKGVQITKQCIRTFMKWFSNYCELSGNSNIVMNQVSYSFDVSVISVYIGLSEGKTLYVIDKQMTDNYQELFSSFKSSDIALWVTTPSYAELCLMDESFNHMLLPKLEKMIFAGEVLTKKHLNKLYERFPGVKIINGYGPTEATVLVTAAEIDDQMMKSDEAIPIGYEMIGGKIIIVDESGKELEQGDKGELVIIGDSVSPGYYNNEELTKKVFYDVEEGNEIKRAYKTGDLVYKDKNGLIYYCGRKDFQIKLNGYRIEIEDIESNIRNLDFVSNTVVLPVYKENKISHLTSFVTLKEKSEEKEFKIALRVKEELKKLIPSYMVPRTIKVKEAFPINSNGKIDRKMLMEELN